VVFQTAQVDLAADRRELADADYVYDWISYELPSAPMMTADPIHTGKIAGRKRLYLDTLYDPDRTGRFFQWPHPSPEAFISCARRVTCNDTVDRARITRLLLRQNEALDAPGAALDNARKLADPKSVCVFTGQQAGLLGGPLYTQYKALAVIGWAAQLEKQLGRPVVPVFWMAADDHDFEEIRWTAFPDTQNDVQRLQLDVPGLPERTPASQITLGDDIHRVLNELQSLQLTTEFSDSVTTALHEDYTPSRTMVEAFGRWMTRMLGPLGLVMFDPSDPEAKSLSAPLVAEELRGPDDTASALADIGYRLEEAGYHKQVAHPDGHTHLFYIAEGRHALRFANGRLWTDPEGGDRARPSGEWVSILERNATAFSPGVLFRPVVQSYLFPVVAAVCGPSEIAYWAQARSLFDRFDLTMPVVLPRVSATITESKTVRAVQSLGHHVADFFGDIEALINRHFEQSFPQDLESRFADERAAWRRRLDELKKTVSTFEPTLEKSFDVGAGRILSMLEQLEKKAFQAHKRKGEEIRAKFYKLAAHLYPEGQPQERIFGIAYYLNKYGFGAIERIRRQLRTDTPDHQLLVP